MLLWSPETTAGPDLPAGMNQSQSADSWAAAGEVKVCCKERMSWPQTYSRQSPCCVALRGHFTSLSFCPGL